MTAHFLPPYQTCVVQPNGQCAIPEVPEGWAPVGDWEPYAVSVQPTMEKTLLSGGRPTMAMGTFTAYRRRLAPIPPSE